MSLRLAIVAALGLSLGACATGPKSPRGFRLPDGQVEAGKSAFKKFGCGYCHAVANAPGLPKPIVDPPVPVGLGGKRAFPPTDGQLVTSIINPNHRLSGPKAAVTDAEGKSRMHDYRGEMTIQEMVDLVAFLRSTYTVSKPHVKPTPTPGLMTR